ncbi:MAG TPA: FliH/SctL family protein [Stellaceae bacterium]|nr:FliH/SctL family protein [Stellaceae bacterium]
MSARLNLSGASVLPFQFPSLDGDEPVAPPAAVAAPAAAVDYAAVRAQAAEEAARALAAERAEAHEEGLRRGLEEGREQGYAAGFSEGAKAGEAKMMEAVRRMAAIIGKLGTPVAALEQPVEEAIVALSLEVARCVIGDSVKHSHQFLVRLVREAVAKVPLEMGAPRVMLNPVDLDLIRRLVPEVDDGHAVLVGDDTIEPGGALIVADGEERQIKDRRWNPRTAEGVSEVNLTLSSRWRAVMLTLFDGEDDK